jgi:uncharacterized LabA/DUF88 family protein
MKIKIKELNNEKMKNKNKKERIMIFIDGSNFYYSTFKKGKKIDFGKLVKELSSGRKLVQAFYYVAPLDIKIDEEKYWKHQRFIEILNNIPNFEVVLCTLKKLKAKDGSYVYLVKGDDVKLSNNLLMGAVENLYDVAIVVSGDEDFVDSINIIRKKYGKKIGNAFFSKSSSENLRKACDFVINLDKIINKIIGENESSVLSKDHTEH